MGNTVPTPSDGLRKGHGREIPKAVKPHNLTTCQQNKHWILHRWYSYLSRADVVQISSVGPGFGSKHIYMAFIQHPHSHLRTVLWLPKTFWLVPFTRLPLVILHVQSSSVASSVTSSSDFSLIHLCVAERLANASWPDSTTAPPAPASCHKIPAGHIPSPASLSHLLHKTVEVWHRSCPRSILIRIESAI